MVLHEVAVVSTEETTSCCVSVTEANGSDQRLTMIGTMVRMSLSTTVGRWIGIVACLPLLLLMGCPQSQSGTAGKVSPQVTAPAVGVGPEGVGGRPGTTARTQAAPAAPVADTAKTRKAQDLINQAERAYTSGVNNYRAGHLDAARVDFDFAVDLMLTSGLDLKTDPQMADEFDHLLNAVNSLEIAALKQGNGFSAPIEAAPLDAADEVTFPPNAELTAKVRAELQTTKSDFPLVVNDYVAGFISYFTNSPGGHAHLLRSLERAGKYKDMIAKNLQEAGVPQDLIYLAVTESGFQPQALNARSGAAGMWQFMPFQGAYGLTRNGWYDERFDPDKSSKAYARYMKTLYAQFGDWYLAMAAYNWGPGNVQRAVMRTGYADFWELYRRGVLPTETKNYVPGIIAAIIMAKNPLQYGLDNIVPSPPVVTDTVTTNYGIDLRLVADLTEAPVAEIVALNPSLLRTSTPGDLPFDLHVPLGTKAVFEQRVKAIPEARRASWRFHVVRPGESLQQIATLMRARVSDIVETNGITAGDEVGEGDELVIPLTTVSSATHPQRYTIRRGDTLVTVADRFNVTVDELRRWNHLSSSAAVPGHSLSVVEPLRMGPIARVRGKASRGRASASVRAAASRRITQATVSSRGSARGSKGSSSTAVKTKSTRASSGATTPKTRHRSFR